MKPACKNTRLLSPDSTYPHPQPQHTTATMPIWEKNVCCTHAVLPAPATDSAAGRQPLAPRKVLISHGGSEVGEIQSAASAEPDHLSPWHFHGNTQRCFLCIICPGTNTSQSQSRNRGWVRGPYLQPTNLSELMNSASRGPKGNH